MHMHLIKFFFWKAFGSSYCASFALLSPPLGGIALNSGNMQPKIVSKSYVACEEKKGTTLSSHDSDAK